MSLLTDAIDAPGNVEVPLSGPSGIVATESLDLARAAAALRERGDLVAAVRAGLEGASELVLVGFSSTSAEPFAIGPAAADEVLVAAVEALAGRAHPLVRDPLWAGHRGHGVWLHPDSLDSARLFLALRLAEATAPATALGEPAAILSVSASALEAPSALGAALEPEAFEKLVDEALEPAKSRVVDGVSRARSLVVFDGIGATLAVSVSSLALPVGLVERAGRPFLAPLRPATPAAFVALLHQAIDLDVGGALTQTGGARLDPTDSPELVGFGELVPATRS